jgi:hypothetical protein
MKGHYVENRVLKIAVVTNYNFNPSHAKMPDVRHVLWQLIIEITLAACAASRSKAPLGAAYL